MEDTGMNYQQEIIAILTQALREKEEYIEELQEDLSQANEEIESKEARIKRLISAKKSCFDRLKTLKDVIYDLQHPHQYVTINGRSLNTPEGYIQRRNYFRYIRIF